MTLDLLFSKNGIHAVLVDLTKKRKDMVQNYLGFFQSTEEIKVTAAHVRHIENGKIIKEMGHAPSHPH